MLEYNHHFAGDKPFFLEIEIFINYSSNKEIKFTYVLN